MKLLLTPLISLCLLCSCDKAKQLAGQAAAKIKQQAAGTSGGASADPALLKLVDQTDEGVVFRKDLPFPKHVRVSVSTFDETNLRLFETSAIERKNAALNGVIESTVQLELNGDRLTFTPGKFRMTDPSTKDADGNPKVITDSPLGTGAPARGFRLQDGKWRADAGGDFLVAATSREIAPHVDVLLRENALAPRRQWFAKRRFKPGDELVLTGEPLAMIFSGTAGGTLRLKMESISAVAGHPCAVFGISGDFSRKKFPSFEGRFTDEDVTIQSGKVWLSLIHPLVLKFDLETILSFKSGEDGGQRMHAQGSSKLTRTLEWQAVAP